MRNLNHYNLNCFELYKLAVNRKQNEYLQNRLAVIAHDISDEFAKYSQSFAANAIEELVPDPKFLMHRIDLLSLYSFRSKTIQEVRRNIQDQLPLSIRNTCQYCGISSVGTMDHFVPKEEFPVFAVNPLNLIPACRDCNSIKSHIWRLDGRRVFLNLYLDKLPSVQFLFVNIFRNENNELDFKYELRNENGVDGQLFTLIQNHFDRLHLTERMRESAGSYLSEFFNSMKASIQDSTVHRVKSLVRLTAAENRISYGFNHWKPILDIALIESEVFWDFVAEG